jgi:hypothetical protein
MAGSCTSRFVVVKARVHRCRVRTVRVLEVEIMSHPSTEYHEHDPEPGSGLTGYAAIKYTAIVIIVLAILAFLAWYIVPKF